MYLYIYICMIHINEFRTPGKMKDKQSKRNEDLNSTMMKAASCGLLKDGQFSEGIWFKKKCPLPTNHGSGNMYVYMKIYV